MAAIDSEGIETQMLKRRRDTIAKLRGPRNLAERVYEQIEKAIVDLRIKPGEEIQEVKLAERFGTSVTPVREALHRLAGDGLIIREANKPPRVALFTEEEIENLYDIRAVLESFGIAAAVPYITPDDISQLKDLQEKGEEFHDSGMLEEYKAYNDQLHQQILSHSRNKLLMQIMATIKIKNRLCVSSTVMIPGRSEQAIKEHREMIALLAEKKAHGARDLMKRHIELAKMAFLESYREEVSRQKE